MKEKNQKICEFLKDAWCVDGNVEFVCISHITPRDVESIKVIYLTEGATYLLNDSIRGKFYITMHRDIDQQQPRQER